MKQLATTANDLLHQKHAGKMSRGSQKVNYPGIALSQSPASIQLKGNCACGGSCSRCEQEKDIQAKLKVGSPNDKFEQEADRVADQVMQSSGSSRVLAGADNQADMIQTKPKSGNVSASSPASLNLSGTGKPLTPEAHTFFGSRMGFDFDNVRIHTNNSAARSAQSLQARAYTQGSNIVFNRGEYDPHSNSGKRLLAHELTHVIQQNNHANTGIQREVQLRPPGRGEATAFDRAQELVDRLNSLSLGVSYFLAADGRTLNYRSLLPTEIDNFDQQMMDFMDLPQVIPMRLITSAGTENGVPIVIDSFRPGYVDLDDLMASDDHAFQSNLIHILEERAVTNRYEQRIGSASLDVSTPLGLRTFNRGHRAGTDAEAEYFRDVFNDPSIVFNRERRRNNAGDFDIIFRSQTHGYRVIQRLSRAAPVAVGRRARRVTGGTMRVVHQGQTYTVDEFLTTGPLAATLRPLRLPFNRGQFGLGMPGLQLNPNLRFGAPGGFGAQPSLGVPPSLGPTLPQLNTPLAPASPSFLSLTPSLSPDVSLIDWLPIRAELHIRGAPVSDAMLDSITSLWMTNYRFLNRTIGLSPDRAAFWTNKTIPMAVGSSISGDYPSMIEQIDREMNTSSIILPASDVLFFLIGGGGTF